MAELLPGRSFTYRKSCNGILIRLRVDPADTWLTVERGLGREYFDIPLALVDGALAQFGAIQDSDEFKAFLSTYAISEVEGTG